MSQTDTVMPKRYALEYSNDAHRLKRMAAAVTAAVTDIMADGRDCRVLLLGAGIYFKF